MRLVFPVTAVKKNIAANSKGLRNRIHTDCRGFKLQEPKTIFLPLRTRGIDPGGRKTRDYGLSDS